MKKHHTFSLAVLVSAFLAGCAASTQQSDYVGQENRDIKAMSADKVRGLLDGQGLGYAKAAELNGYPGPAHVLELADALNLTAEQRAQSEKVFAQMQADARQLGKQLVDAERSIELAFRDKRINAELLEELTASAGEIESRIRNAHLAAHIEQTAILSPAQVTAYVKLRGYGSGKHGAHGKHKH